MSQWIYIAGPMRGYPDFNRPAFEEAAEMLRSKGWLVHSPVERDIAMYGDKMFQGNPTGSEEYIIQRFGFDIRQSMAENMRVLCESDAIYLLDGWINSKGAYAEYALARCLGLKVIVQGFYCSPQDDPEEES